MLQFQRHFLHMKHTGSENDRIIDKTKQKKAAYLLVYKNIFYGIHSKGYTRREKKHGKNIKQ